MDVVGHYHEFVYPHAKGKMLQREYLAPDYFSNRKEARGEAVCSLTNNLGKGAHAFTFFKCEHVEPRSAVVVPVGSEAKLRHAQSILGRQTLRQFSPEAESRSLASEGEPGCGRRGSRYGPPRGFYTSVWANSMR